MTERRWRIVAYVVVVSALCFGLYRVETRAKEVGRTAAATRALATRNKANLDAISADRQARIAARCTQDHALYQAAQQAFEAQRATFGAQEASLALIDQLIHQSDPAQVASQFGLSDEARAYLLDQRAKADEALVATRAQVDEARAKVEDARKLIQQTDCDPASAR